MSRCLDSGHHPQICSQNVPNEDSILLGIDRSDRESVSMSTAYSVMMYLNCMPTHSPMDKAKPHSHDDGTDEVGDNTNTLSVHPLHCLIAVTVDNSAGLHAARELCGEMIADRAHLVLLCCIILFRQTVSLRNPGQLCRGKLY